MEANSAQESVQAETAASEPVAEVEQEARPEVPPEPADAEQPATAAEAVPEPDLDAEAPAEPAEEMAAEQLLIAEPEPAGDEERIYLKALLEAVVYITEEPLTVEQMATALDRPIDVVQSLLDELVAEYAQPSRGLTIREVAGGYKMGTRPEHHEAIRTFVRNLKPPLKLSLPALETLAVIAYKQPITAPEIMDIRGVQGAGVLKTLLDRKLIAAAGRKNVVGKPILYKTTREFLVQFGLRDLAELPTLKEFEELGRLALSDEETISEEPAEPPAIEPEPQPDGDPEPLEPPIHDPQPDPAESPSEPPGEES